jgi:hypothetical protein
VPSPNMTAVTFWRSNWSTRDDRGTLQTMALPFIWMARRSAAAGDAGRQCNVAGQP